MSTMQNATSPTSSTLKISNELIARNRESSWPDLTPQEKAFCVFYVETYDMEDSRKKAKLSAEKAKGLIRNPLSMAYINDCQEVMAQRSVISRDFVNVQWLKLLPKVMGEEDVALGVDKDGNQLEGKKFEPSAVAKIMTELSKSTNFYAEGSGQSASVNINIDLGALGIKSEGITIDAN